MQGDESDVVYRMNFFERYLRNSIFHLSVSDLTGECERIR